MRWANATFGGLLQPWPTWSPPSPSSRHKYPFRHSSTLSVRTIFLAYEQGASPYQLCLKNPSTHHPNMAQIVFKWVKFSQRFQICHGGGRKAQKNPEKGHKNHTKKTRKGREKGGKKTGPQPKKPRKIGPSRFRPGSSQLHSTPFLLSSHFFSTQKRKENNHVVSTHAIVRSSDAG